MNFPTALRLIEREEEIETRESRANDQNVARLGELRMNFGGVRVVHEPLAFLVLRRFTRREVSQRENDLAASSLLPDLPINWNDPPSRRVRSTISSPMISSVPVQMVHRSSN